MKAVMLSIQPKWCELIASGKKTIEVRRTAPKLETPFKCYIYCTKDAKKHYYIDEYGDRKVELIPTKIIGEFICDKIYEIYTYQESDNSLCAYSNEMEEDELWLESVTGLSEEQIVAYLGVRGYGWHISDLKIYDTPKELTDFLYPCKRGFPDASAECKGCRYAFQGMSHGEIYCDRAVLTAPQSWCYVEEFSE